MPKAGVRSKSGTPVLSDFASEDGTPIVVDTATGKAYVLDDTNTVTAIKGSDTPQFTSIELGHASDTTLTRVSAGVMAVEGSNVLLASGLGSVTQAYDADIPTEIISQADAEAGTSTVSKAWTAERVAQAIAALGGNASITLGTPQATTSGTSIDFTSIPSWTKMIVASLNGISTNGTSKLIWQLGDAGGIEATGYVGTTTDTATGTAWSTYATITESSLGAADVRHAQIVMTLVNSSTNTWHISIVSNLQASTLLQVGEGYKSLSATLDRVRLTTAGGANTFDAGEINILYFG